MRVFGGTDEPREPVKCVGQRAPTAAITHNVIFRPLLNFFLLKVAVICIIYEPINDYLLPNASMTYCRLFSHKHFKLTWIKCQANPY